MWAVLAQHGGPSDSAIRLILVVVLAGFVAVLLEAVIAALRGQRDDERESRGRRR